MVFDFSLADAIASRKNLGDSDPIPEVWKHNWGFDSDDKTPRLGVDKEGVPLVLWMPQFISGDVHVSASRHVCLTVVDASPG